jgi:CRP/FNR family transcriptional regulator, anaerobic regulatory protein
MPIAEAPRTRSKIPCRDCRHRSGVGFRDLSPSELEFMTEIKDGHGIAWTGELLVRQGEISRLLGTLYSGLAIKYRLVAKNCRQVVAVVMPGDLIGLENAYGVPASYSLEAVTDVTFCRFDPAKWGRVLENPDLASRVTELLLADQRHIEDRFAAAAGCTALRNLAHFVLDMHDRLSRRRLIRDNSFGLPLTNQQFADALGLTTVHLHRVLRRMREDRIFVHDHRRIIVQDLEKLRKIVGVAGPLDEIRPLF